MKILFVCKQRNNPDYPEGTYGLWNSANFVAIELANIGHQTKVVSVIDGNGIDKEVYHYKPDMVILEAIWVTPEKVEELQKRYPKIKWVVRVHSKATFLANEGIAFEWINRYLETDVIVAVNNIDFYNDLIKIGYKVSYLPNIYNAQYCVEKKTDYNTRFFDVGCFGSLRPMKNQLNQAIAAIQFADDMGLTLRFHINSTRAEQNGQNVLRNLRALFSHTNHMLIEHGWLTHKNFCKLVAYMDLGMQVSLSESFNIVTADFVSVGVPVVVCPEIKFVSSLFTANPVDTKEIVRAMKFAYYGAKIGLHKWNKKYLDSYNLKAVEDWIKFLS